VERVDYLGGLRRRWFIILAAIAVGMFGAWLTRSVGPSTSGRFEAGTPLLGSTDPAVTNLATLSALTTLGEVPRRVAKSLQFEGDPANLAARVAASPDQGTGILWIVADGPTALQAERLANAFAHELVAWVDQSRISSTKKTAERLQEQIDEQKHVIAEIEDRIARANARDTAILTAERDAAIQQYGILIQQHSAATEPALAPSPLSILQLASAAPIEGNQLLGPLSMAGRLAVGGALGLLAGLGLALVLERFDRRIRTRAGAERSFRLPVLAEIPSLRRRERRAIVDDDGRVSPTLQPFRLLAAQLGPGGGVSTAAPGGNGHRAPPGQLLLVTSPGSAEGKSRVVGSLAASYAESGRKVLVVSCDLRRPLVHKLLRVPEQPGLSDALTSGNGSGLLQPVAQNTPLPNLKVIPSGHPTDNPNRLISSDQMLRVLDEARQAADVVLVDAAPLLAGGEAAYLLSEADAVLLVARTGRTTVDEAERTAELLERLDAPVAGVALTANA
jgi:capsular exopolysaccharide synthesis family protein